MPWEDDLILSGLNGLSGSQLAELLEIAVLGFSIFVAANKRLELSIAFLALQAVALAGLAALAGLGAEALGDGGDLAHVYWSAGLVLAVKAGAVPLVLWYFAARARGAFADDFNSLHSLVAALGLIVLAFWIGRSLSELQNLIDPRGMTAAMALSLVGLLVMVGRRNALAQVLGLAVLENGVFLASVAATRGMPLAVEAAVLADLVLGAMIMGYLSYRIHRAFDTLDTGKLNTLRG